MKHGIYRYQGHANCFLRLLNKFARLKFLNILLNKRKNLFIYMAICLDFGSKFGRFIANKFLMCFLILQETLKPS